MKHIFTVLCCFSILCLHGQVDLKDASNTVIGSYTTIAAAYSNIPANISSPYIIELTGSYSAAAETFPVNLSNRTGASGINTITIRPSTGATNVSITSNVSGAGTIKLTDADFIIFDGRPGGTGTSKELTIGNTNAASSSSCIDFINGSSDNIVRYCKIIGAFTTNATRGIYLGGIVAGNTSGNSNNLFLNSYFSGSRSFINASGSSTAAFFGSGNTIKGCDFDNIRFAGIWVQAGYADFVIDSSRMYCSSSAGHTSTGAFAILMDFQNGGLTITRNYISINNGTYTTKVRAISLRSSNTASSLNMANNFISLTDANATSASVGALEFGDNTLDDNFTANIHFNTIRIGGIHTNGTSGSVLSAAFIFTKTYANHEYNISNNIIVNERTGPAGVIHTAYWIPTAGAPGTKNLDYNTYNITGENFAVINTTTYNGFSNYQSAVGSNETHSNTTAVQLVSNTDLHLTGTSISNIDLGGSPVSGITNDYDNDARHAIPYRGGDEVSTAPLPVKLILFNAFGKNADVLINWSTASEQNSMRYEIQRSLNGSEYSTIGSMKAAGSSYITLNYSYIDAEALRFYQGRNLYYRLKTVDMDGRFVYSPSVLLRQQETKSFTVNTYPNPFKAAPSLSIYTPVAGTASIRLTDVSGRIVYTGNLFLPQGNSVLQLPVFNQANGIYFLQVQMSTAKISVRLLKE